MNIYVLLASVFGVTLLASMIQLIFVAVLLYVQFRAIRHLGIALFQAASEQILRVAETTRTCGDVMTEVKKTVGFAPSDASPICKERGGQ